MGIIEYMQCRYSIMHMLIIRHKAHVAKDAVLSGFDVHIRNEARENKFYYTLSANLSSYRSRHTKHIEAIRLVEYDA